MTCGRCYQVGKKKPEGAAKKAAGRKDSMTRAAPKTTKPPDEPTLPMEERIVNLLVPEMKVADVMLLIKKMKQAGKSDADEFSELDADQKTGARVTGWRVCYPSPTNNALVCVCVCVCSPHSAAVPL